jgi:hypothetical protein
VLVEPVRRCEDHPGVVSSGELLDGLDATRGEHRMTVLAQAELALLTDGGYE